MKHSSKRLNAKTIGSSSSMCAQLQQMLTLLLMVIALCASRTASSPTQQQLHQQRQQGQQGQQQLQHEQQKHQTTTIRVQQCREGCLEKFTTKNPLCQQTSECSMCWDECGKAATEKISKSIRETWSLHTVSMVQQDSLVLVNVAWDQLSVPYQCLVTWEVSGGGLMGNLLTESFSVQLSLWPDTKYRVQVTCKNKLSGLMSRSLPLSIDTSNAVTVTDTDVDISGLHRTMVSLIAKLPESQRLSTTTATAVSLAPTQESTNVEGELDTNVVPYDYPQQTSEAKYPEIRFNFSWNIIRKNNDITSIEPLQPSEGNLMAILSNIHRPLLFGMTAGVVLLILLLLFFACPLRNPRLSSDKAMLIAEDFNVDQLTRTPAQMLVSKIPASATPAPGNACKSTAACSRHTPRV